jgi:hypothetical protein
MTMNDVAQARGCLVVGSVAAFVLLLAGVAVPLAGGTDFNGAPRLLGTLLILIVWLIAIAVAVRAQQWGWLVTLVIIGPPVFVLYGTLISEDFMFPDAWEEFGSPPWYLIALTLTPVVLLLYGLLERESRRRH